MAERFTSRVGQRGLDLYNALAASTYPPHPTTGFRPQVTFADLDPDEGFERICVVLDVDATSIEWVRTGPAGRDETIVFNVLVKTRVPLEDDTAAVWGRLTQLVDVVQAVAYDTTSNQVVAIGTDNAHVLGARVSAVAQRIDPDPEGWLGVATVTFTFKERI
jgi:hypothetical protein